MNVANFKSYNEYFVRGVYLSDDSRVKRYSARDPESAARLARSRDRLIEGSVRLSDGTIVLDVPEVYDLLRKIKEEERSDNSLHGKMMENLNI